MRFARTRLEFGGLTVCSRSRRGYFVRTHFNRELPPVQPVVGSNGLEPSTSRLSGVRSNHLSYEPMSVAVSVTICGQPVGGDEQNRTVDPLLARQVLSQLSYTPVLAGLPPPSFESPYSGPSKLNNAKTR